MAKFDVASNACGIVLGSYNDNTPYIGDCNGSTTNSTGLRFLTQSETRMMINPSGNVGFGTTSPIPKVDVNGAAILRNQNLTFSSGGGGGDTTEDVALVFNQGG